MAHRNDPLAAGVHTAHAWLNAVADELGTEDRQFAFRALRAWMHTVRDRIGVSNSAHMSAQLPEFLRGVWYEGWVPARVPVRHGVAAFIDQFAEQARIDRGEVVPIAGKITRALDQLFAPGQLTRVPSRCCPAPSASPCGVISSANPRLRTPHLERLPSDTHPIRTTTSPSSSESWARR
ncbi:DUF2267 domain-containing protein [Nocardia sp. NPDC050193]